MFGLLEVPGMRKHKRDAGLPRQVLPGFVATVISAPVGTPPALREAVGDIASNCGPDEDNTSVLLGWLKVEAGEESALHLEACAVERVSVDHVTLEAFFGQWEEVSIPITDFRRILIDMMDFLTGEARTPLPAWRIKHLGHPA
ncbi:hypothetical protein [Streptomyces sp. NPDC091209]|uniref:hypothetical protein n=1 Tax=Streptomyces sp. NPDC091209 TaxID=3365974 RepID=UPI00381CB0CC